MWREFVNTHYYILCVLLILISMGIFFISFEKRKPKAREVICIAVMSALAVASRAAFIMIPHFKPMIAIIMITGMAFGSEAGFLTGALSGFVSNFIFGQGPWTPWQMFAYGVAGALAGIMRKKGWITEEKKLRTAIVGFGIVLGIVGPILDTCAVFMVSTISSGASVLAIYLSGLPVNIIHGMATFLTLFFLCQPITEKLNRVKVKYGMMDVQENEI